MGRNVLRSWFHLALPAAKRAVGVERRVRPLERDRKAPIGRPPLVEHFNPANWGRRQRSMKMSTVFTP